MRETASSDLYVPTAAGKVFVRVWGEPRRLPERAPIVLFHDSLGCVELWRDFPAALAHSTGRAVVAYDRLGFGRSDPRAGALDPGFVRAEAQVALPALRAELELDRMILFGHSVGGAMAVAAAGAFPDYADAVITEAAQAFVEDLTVAGIEEARRNFQSPEQFARLARYHGTKARWVLDAWVDIWHSPRFAAWTLDDDLRRLRCPVLAVHGERDEYGSRRHSQRIGALAAATAEVVILEDCGHIPHRERPERLLDLASRFLSARLARPA